jgi:hypothetical protein
VDLREFAAALGWTGVAALFLAALLARSALGAAGVLYLIGWLLDAVLVTALGWIGRHLPWG